ncbi:hypothetical protein AKG39_13195 [Acetobacterium bakii]|uniref:GGDEF domain-containing protein n=2 Tax=Acetobacterium bakii TaxID=52689 RepID=A0A0L6TYU8_9FIRM|nr:hypothetical protein AKG39_13195 [Acetobacterium bakii]
MGDNATLYDILRSNRRLMILIAIFITGFILFAMIGYKTITNIKINGELYDEIILGKELVADVLPPPGYIIESYLVTLQLAKETDTVKIEELISREAQLKKDYVASHETWSSRLPEGKLKKNMAENAYRPAMEFFDVFENELIPLIKSGEQEKANDLLALKLDPLYLEHRYAIDQVVSLANDENEALEATAGKIIAFNIFILIVLAIAVLATVVIFCIGIIKNEKLKKMSFFDGLTGIPNRRYFDQVLLQEISRAEREKKPLSLMIIDIDHYKEYNDTYGHLLGDQCLKIVVSVLKKNLKRSGDFLARYGGDEFILILPNTTDEGGASLAEKLRASVEEMSIPNINSLCSNVVTLSIGVVTTFSRIVRLPDDLIAAADSALYLSKEKGRNQVNVERL